MCEDDRAYHGIEVEYRCVREDDDDDEVGKILLRMDKFALFRAFVI